MSLRSIAIASPYCDPFDGRLHTSIYTLRKLLRRRPGHFMLSAQPLPQPLPSVLFHSPVGFADWTEAEVVGPPNHHSVESPYHGLLIQQSFIPSGLAADRLTDANHPFLGRHGAQIGPPRLRRVAASERVSQKIELLFRQLADPRLRLVHRQFQLLHDSPHRGERFFRVAPTADHQIVGIVNDVRSQTLLVPQLLPAEHEPAHV